MGWEIWFLLVLVLSILILGPLFWALWTIRTAVKNREKAQDMILGTFFTGGMPHHVLCYKKGVKIIPPKEVRRPVESDKEGPGDYYFSDSCKVDDLWPLNKSKRIQVPIAHLFYNEGNPNPLNPHDDFKVFTSSVMVKAIADEKSAVALLSRMKEESRDAKSMEDSLKSSSKTLKYLLYAIAALAVMILINIIVVVMASSKVGDVLNVVTQIKSSLGIGG